MLITSKIKKECVEKGSRQAQCILAVHTLVYQYKTPVAIMLRFNSKINFWETRQGRLVSRTGHKMPKRKNEKRTETEKKRLHQPERPHALRKGSLTTAGTSPKGSLWDAHLFVLCIGKCNACSGNTIEDKTSLYPPSPLHPFLPSKTSGAWHAQPGA
eukprot:scaffold62561_cov17-Tisochrysis_lutea.AAC.4